jgi:hypothetical protein
MYRNELLKEIFRQQLLRSTGPNLKSKVFYLVRYWGDDPEMRKVEIKSTTYSRKLRAFTSPEDFDGLEFVGHSIHEAKEDRKEIHIPGFHTPEYTNMVAGATW